LIGDDVEDALVVQGALQGGGRFQEGLADFQAVSDLLLQLLAGRDVGVDGDAPLEPAVRRAPHGLADQGVDGVPVLVDQAALVALLVGLQGGTVQALGIGEMGIGRGVLSRFRPESSPATQFLRGVADQLEKGPISHLEAVVGIQHRQSIAHGVK